MQRSDERQRRLDLEEEVRTENFCSFPIWVFEIEDVSNSNANNLISYLGLVLISHSIICTYRSRSYKQN